MLPTKLITEFWEEALQLLTREHGVPEAQARAGIADYRWDLALHGADEVVFNGGAPRVAAAVADAIASDDPGQPPGKPSSIATSNGTRVNGDIAYSVVYRILKEIAEQRRLLNYKDLSQYYESKTGRRVYWRNWGPVLGQICTRLAEKKKPPLPAVVVNSKLGMPGENFFGLPNTPKTPSRSAWKRTLEAVYDTRWPDEL